MFKIEKYINHNITPENYIMTQSEIEEFDVLNKKMEDGLLNEDNLRLNYLNRKSFKEWLHDEPQLCDDSSWNEEIIMDDVLMTVKIAQISSSPYVIINNSKKKLYISEMDDNSFSFWKPFIDYWFSNIDSREFHGLILNNEAL